MQHMDAVKSEVYLGLGHIQLVLYYLFCNIAVINPKLIGACDQRHLLDCDWDDIRAERCKESQRQPYMGNVWAKSHGKAKSHVSWKEKADQR